MVVARGPAVCGAGEVLAGQLGGLGARASKGAACSSRLASTAASAAIESAASSGPAILIHQDEGAGGNVTGPAGDGRREGRLTTGGSKAWSPLDRAGITAGLRGRCRRRGPRLGRHGRGFRYDPDPLIRG